MIDLRHTPDINHITRWLEAKLPRWTGCKTYATNFPVWLGED